MKRKDPKLIREIREIINNPELHFWTKCKHLTFIEAYNRPGSQEGEKLITEFFETCAGKYKNRFESAYVRPYLNNWQDRDAYDHVRKVDLNNDLTAKIGRNPRGIKTIRKLGSTERFTNYLRHKYPDAFEEFEEIKKVQYPYYAGMEKTSDRAWQHIFHRVRRNYYPIHGHERSFFQTTKERQKERRKLDLAMEKAQADYDKLKKASKLPPRYTYNEVSLAELQQNHANHTYAIFNGHYITTETVLHYDSSRVIYGLGHLKRTDRTILIRNRRGITFSKTLKSYAGNFVLNAIEERFGMVNNVKTLSELKPVQLNPKMEVVEIAKSKGFRVFRRMFSGTHYDYCVLKGKITYHGSTIETCIAGWKKKKVLSKTGAKIIDMKACRDLGFCLDGVKEFCSLNSLDSHEKYTVEELKGIVKRNLSYNQEYYGRELKQIGVL